MDDFRGDWAMSDENRPSDSQGTPRGPVEHPSIDAKPGFWDGKWTEFKRQFGARMEEQGCALIIAGLVLLVTLFGMQFSGWR